MLNLLFILLIHVFIIFVHIYVFANKEYCVAKFKFSIKVFTLVVYETFKVTFFISTQGAITNVNRIQLGSEITH